MAPSRPPHRPITTRSPTSAGGSRGTRYAIPAAGCTRWTSSRSARPTIPPQPGRSRVTSPSSPEPPADLGAGVSERGPHVIHAGGEYDSHLLAPVRSADGTMVL